MVASVGEMLGTSVAWPTSVTRARVMTSPITAVTMGSAMAVTVPNAKIRITTAAARPIASLDSVAGFESFWPT